MYDIIDMHFFATTAFYKYLWVTIYTINVVLPLSSLSCDDESWHALGQGFCDLNGETVRGCVGDIDEIAIEISKPTAWDTLYPTRFRNRKGFVSLIY